MIVAVAIMQQIGLLTVTNRVSWRQALTVEALRARGLSRNLWWGSEPFNFDCDIVEFGKHRPTPLLSVTERSGLRTTPTSIGTRA